MQSKPFFEFAYERFLTAIRNAGEINRFYRLAGFTFCLKFAGNSMVDLLTPALKHLEVSESVLPDLTICLWDSASTGTSILQDHWPLSGTRGEVFGLNCEEIYTVFDIHTKVLNVFAKERNLALYWLKDGRDLPWWISGSPLQLILHWWMREKGHQLTHAAAVGWAHGGVVLAGKSGSGKSTTALSCMRAGMSYVSEDYCLLSDLPKIQAYSVYNSAKLDSKTLRWFPELEKQVENQNRAEGDKAFLFHQKFQPERIAMSVPVKAILTVKIVEDFDSWLEPIDIKEGVSALSVSTMWQLTHTGPAVFKHLKRVVEALPCYRLHVGSDLERIPKVIGKIL